MFDFDRIVAYGCSLTAGMELADELVTGLSKQEIDRQKRTIGIRNWWDLLESYATVEQISEIENNLAWPRYVADYFGVSYVNRAVHGGNSDSSIYFIESDLKNFLTTKDLILVGHSETTRYFWLDQHGSPQHACMGGTDLRWPSADFHQQFRSFANPHHLTYQWTKDIKYLDMLSHRLGGRLLQQYCSHTYHEHAIVNNLTSHIDSVTSMIDEDYSFNSIVTWSDPDQVHAFTHPTKQLHEIFAKHLIDKLCIR
jgi:hypothetical protein